MQEHISEKIGDTSKVDVFDLDVSRAVLRGIQQRSVSEKAFVSLPGLVAKPLKKGPKWAREKDKELRALQAVAVQALRTDNSSAEHLADSDIT
jgi:hypothetical protein